MKNKDGFPFVFILVMIIIFLFQSCVTTDKVTNSSVIQKRKYTKGFYLNTIRNKKNKDLKIEGQVYKNTYIIGKKHYLLEQSFENFYKETDTSTLYLIASTKEITTPVQKNKLLPISTLNKLKKPTKNNVKQEFYKSKQNKIYKPFLDKPGEEPKMNKLALFGFICSLLALISVIVASFFSIFAAMFSFFFAIPAILCCSIAIFQINRSKGKEKGKIYAVFGLIVGILFYLCAFGLIFLFMAMHKVDLFSGTM